MKRKSVKKSLARRRRLSRARKLKATALGLGLTTAWGGVEADAARINSTATATITISDASAFSISDGNGASATATVTIGLADALGQQGGGSSSDLIPFDLEPGAGYFFIGVSGPDLVLSFPNGGAAAIGEFWGSLFIDPVNGGVTETEVLNQLETGSFGVGEQLDPKSALGRLVGEYGSLLSTPYGEESTFVAFTNNAAGPNHGEFAGTLTQSVVPEPMSLALVVSASGIVLGVRRRA